MSTTEFVELHRAFLRGEPGTCGLTGREGCHAFMTEDEIDCTYGSHHDGAHLAWFGTAPGPVGYVSDEAIDDLMRTGRVFAFDHDMRGPANDLDEERIARIFEIGARRMSAVLALRDLGDAVDMQTDVDALPVAVHPSERSGLSGTIPVWRLIAFAAPKHVDRHDPESNGRLHALARGASGLDPVEDLEKTSREWARRTIRRREDAIPDAEIMEALGDLGSESGIEGERP